MSQAGVDVSSQGREAEQSRVVLVTGASRFLGGYLVTRLAQNPEIERVIAVDTQSPTKDMHRRMGRAEFVLADETAAAAAEMTADAAASESVRLTLELEPAVIEGDRALLERLVANLLENGVRYNRPGGFVAVRTRGVDGAAELEVENSGPLVERAAAGRLAEPFERLQRSAEGGGAGLGLSIVRAVGEAHGGSLAIEPREGGGLKVAVRFPSGAGRSATGSRERRLRGAPASPPAPSGRADRRAGRRAA